MNKAFLIGNLTRDPELRTLPSGISVCTFTIAINRKFVNQQGVREADFLNTSPGGSWGNVRAVPLQGPQGRRSRQYPDPFL